MELLLSSGHWRGRSYIRGKTDGTDYLSILYQSSLADASFPHVCDEEIWCISNTICSGDNSNLCKSDRISCKYIEFDIFHVGV